ncbi:SsrA-binding protein SmpB, partial [Simkania negevensis]|nr:SsrA-binding protein SmpB [Simkania negevensis]
MKKSSAELVSNRKAYHNYEIIDTFEAGIALCGTEVKSLREHNASLQEAYVKVLARELWLIGAYVAPYSFGNIHNHEERRDRKLLMHKSEILKLKKAVQEKGLTLVPLSLYLKKGIVKIRIATAKGKKLHDKRAALKKREDDRRMDTMLKFNKQ